MSTNARIVGELYSALNSRDGEAITALFTDDCVYRSSRASAQEIIGAQGAAKAMQTWLANYRPGSAFETVMEIYSGHEGFNQWRFTATSLDGKAVALHGVEYFCFSDGKISMKSSFLKF